MHEMLLLQIICIQLEEDGEAEKDYIFIDLTVKDALICSLGYPAYKEK